MRFITWLLLVCFAVAAVMSGRLGIALMLAGAKAALVGVEYMELRHAHKLHAAAFLIGVVGVVLLLEVLAGGV